MPMSGAALGGSAHAMRSSFGVFLMTLCVAPALAAQVVRGDVRDEGTGQPLYGAIVVLLDSAGKQTVGTMTDEAGSFAVKAPSAGRYALRAERIGYRSTVSSTFDLALGETVERRLQAPMVPVSLTAVTVKGSNKCVVRPAEGLQSFALWQEARKALYATHLASEDRRLHVTVKRYVRLIDPNTMQTRREASYQDSYFAEHPFATPRSAEDLARHGWVQRDAEFTNFYGPDADILLSDAFADTHCFRVKKGKHEEKGLIGLAFEPAKKHRVADVKGVLWIDPRTAELRFLEFRHTGLFGPDIAPHKYGGRVEFGRLSNGAWIVRRWWIRWPQLASEIGAGPMPGDLRDITGLTRQVDSFREEGGQVLSVIATTDPRARVVP
jgi:Carboxypeptidase regulatory-like domain